MATISFGLITTLTVGVRGKDFVIVGSSKRELYGPFVISEKGTLMRIFDNRVIVAFSGHVPDIQYVFRELSWFFHTEQLNRNRKLSLEEAANFLGLLLFSYKLFPNIAFGIIAGIDLDGKSKLYDVDPLGSILEDDYVASGLSTEVAYGILESGYKKDMSFDDAKKLVLEAFKMAAKRDVLVGKYADIAYIRKQEGQLINKIETVELA